MATTTTTTHAHAETTSADPPRWATLALLCVAQLMLILDITVVNVALPDISADLHLRQAALTWVVTAYTLAFGGLMLLGGRVADLLGARRTLLAGLALFTAASLLAGLSDSAALLLSSRVTQGIGAAFLSPAALSLVSTTFQGEQRSKALGVWAAVGGAGSALGVIVGGVLTSAAGWRWVFFINVPIGIVLLLVLPRLITSSRQQGHRAALDVPGAMIVTSATAAVIYGLINVGGHGWSATSTLLPIGAGVILYALFGVVEQSVESPLIDVRLLKRRAVAAGSMLMLVATGLLVGSFFLGSFYLQHERGYSAVHTGLAFLPIAVGTGLGAHLAGRALMHARPRVIGPVGLGLAALGLAAGALWLNPIALVMGLSVAGLGIGATFVTAIGSALANVEHRESGLRSGIVNTFHELGGAIGVAVVSSVAGASLTVMAAGTAGFTWALTVSAVAALGAAVLALLVMPAGRTAVGAGPYTH